MQDLNDKVTGNTLTANEWNQLPSEVQNVIEALGIVLSGADVNQLGKAIAGYVANGTFYADSGAANAYVLAQIGTKQSPTAYTDGMTIDFLPGNANSGASTVNVSGLGVKDIRDAAGNVLTAGALITTRPTRAVYNATAGHFRSASAAYADLQVSATDSTSGRIVTTDGTELTARTAPKKVTHNMASDANYTLTASQELFGRVVITDTGVVLSTARSIICSTAERGYLFQNDSGQILTLKTAAGTGIAVSPGEAQHLLCDGTNVVSAVVVGAVGAVYGEAVRQTVLTGATDANGQANFLSAGTGLAVSRAATAVPVVATVAAGEGASGPINYRNVVSATQASFWSGLAPNNISYLFDNRDVVTEAWTAYSTLVPPQYGAFFDVNKQALLHFEGADASTTMTDDYMKTWTAYGNAQIDTAQFKIGASSALFDGTGDYVENITIKSLGSGWTIGCWIRRSVVTTNTNTVFSFGSSANPVAQLSINNATNTVNLRLSSNGTSDDITNSNSATTIPNANQWYHVALVHDPVAGKYFVYLDGAQIMSVTSSALCAALATNRIGINQGALNGFEGWIDEFEFAPYCKYPNGTTFTPSTSVTVPNAEWFDLSSFTYKYGSPTSWTTKQRVCVGKTTTSATVPTSVTTYALRRLYTSPLQTVPSVGTQLNINHNIGVNPDISINAVCVTADAGYSVGDSVELLSMNDGTSGRPINLYKTDDTAGLVTGSGAALQMQNKTTGTIASATAGSWKLRVNAKGNW